MNILSIRVWLAPMILSTTLACGGSLAQQRKDQAAVAHELSATELLRKGEASASVGDMTRAEQYYAAALRAGGDEKTTVQKLLVACVADQRYPVAVEYAEQYLHRHPEDPEMQFAAASLHAALGDTMRARRLLALVLRQRPRWSEAHYALASVLREDETATDAADQHDLEYLKLDPLGPLAATARARLRRNLQ